MLLQQIIYCYANVASMIENIFCTSWQNIMVQLLKALLKKFCMSKKKLVMEQCWYPFKNNLFLGQSSAPLSLIQQSFSKDEGKETTPICVFCNGCCWNGAIQYFLTKLVYPVSIKDEGLVVCSQFHIGPAARSGPANPHIASAQGLKLKVPFSRLHSICLLHAEEADGLNALIIHHMDGWSQGEIWRKTRCLW